MKFRLSPVFAFSLLLPAIVAGSSCSDDGPTDPADTGSPLIEVRFPTNPSEIDRDGDGLLDLEIAFRDSGTGIDASTIRLTADRGLKGGPAAGSGLTELWAVARADSAGLIIEETVDRLLPRGEVRLTVSVADRAGNSMSRQVSLELPPAARHRVLDLETYLDFNSGQIILGPTGDKAYVTTNEDLGSAISIVDLHTLTLLRVVRSPIHALSETAFDAARNRLYLMSMSQPFVGVFDLGSESFLEPIAVSSRGRGIALSRKRDRLYGGLDFGGGSISVVDLAQGVEERVIDLGIINKINPLESLHMFELLLDQGEDRLFASTGGSAQQGILVIDPDAGVLLDQIDVWPENPQLLGDVSDLQLDGGNLIATTSNRIALIPLAAPEAIRFGFTAAEIPLIALELAIAPGGTEWAVTAADFGAGFHAVQLMDAASLRVVWQDSLPASAWNPRAVAFRPDGNVFMAVGSRVDLFPATSPAELTIYLYR